MKEKYIVIYFYKVEEGQIWNQETRVWALVLLFAP